MRTALPSDPYSIPGPGIRGMVRRLDCWSHGGPAEFNSAGPASGRDWGWTHWSLGHRGIASEENSLAGYPSGY